MTTKRILVLGGGFAGLWSAAGAARKLDELGLGPADVDMALVNRDAYHSIRVRNYESDLSAMRVPLDKVLDPIGVRTVIGQVAAIDLARRSVAVDTGAGRQALAYDRLILALGSEVARPPIPGAREHTFDVDTYDGAYRLNAHLASLARMPDVPGRRTVVVVGAGLTGIEVATEMPDKWRSIAGAGPAAGHLRIILADRNPQVGSDMGDSARPVIEAALAKLNIETRLGVDVRAVTPHGLRLADGEEIAAQTVVWCAGMRANPSTKDFPVERDRWGRLPVDSFLRVDGVPHVFAAGDVARAMVSAGHASVMSCQHGRPMGRFAGHNAVCDLLGLPMLPLEIDWYVTVLDLGSCGAVYTEGWDRHVVTQGDAAKRTKQTINRERIYPPLTGDRRAILDAAAPVVQSPPRK